ncbi:MAG TPA: UDP-galactopyranose mutase [Lachnospiraceae bacterium]|nr:UDP-galactopyranose mutase [Lachnospiraceae bacterium]
MSRYDTIVVGAGFAGAVVARELAERGGEQVLVIDKRDHIGGNCYDERDEHGILIHRYGPHIFHTNIERVYTYLSRFTEWYDYSHEVVGAVNGTEIPIPFNLNTLDMVFGDRADKLSKKLIGRFGEGARVPILKLLESDDPDLKEIADYVYENIFLKYTMKQWGKKPEEIDPAVSGRVPVLVSRDNRYFQDKYQGMPKDGYTPLFERMLDHPGITVKTGVDARDILSVDPAGEKVLGYEGEPFEGKVVFTGAIDEFFDVRYSRLPYRSLHFRFEHHDREHFQSHGVVNYTVSEDFTRITEFKYLTGESADGTTIVYEYPFEYTGGEGEIPYYAINDPANDALYQKYRELSDKVGMTLLGRLAEYKYYNIDAIVDRALTVVEDWI